MSKRFIQLSTLCAAVMTTIALTFFKTEIISNAVPLDSSTLSVMTAKSFITDYCYAIDQYQSFDISTYTDSISLTNYISNKIISEHYKSYVYDTDDMQNYTVEVNEIEQTCQGEYTFIRLQSIVEFIYKESTVNSEYSTEHWIMIENSNGSFIITDWYMPYNEYDIAVRGELSLSDFGHFYMEGELNSVFSEQKKLNEKIRAYYLEMLNDSISETTSYVQSKPQNQKSLHNLNKTSITTWAANNYNKAYPSSGNSSLVPSYYDFSTISGNWDCTNFASHAILAGGTCLYDTGGSGISSTGWYFRNINNRSSSWSGVSNLYSFLVNNTTKGPSANSISYTDIYAPSGVFPYSPGDLMQFHNGTIWRHSAVITCYLPINGSTTNLEAGITDRVSSTSYNLGIRQSIKYPGENRRVLVLNGYYN